MLPKWWTEISGGGLAQGDLLDGCRMPIFSGESNDGSAQDVDVVEARLLVVTQSCDLEQEKLEFVALCPIHTIDEFADANSKYENRKHFNEILAGKLHTYHMLASPADPGDNSQAYIVDFGHIVSLPLDYLKTHATSIGPRWRLSPPYLEHFSQAFARFFMRVGLPTSIPRFK